jgi:hypothetical protein
MEPNKEDDMTKEQANQIRNLIDTNGLHAVKEHPVLGLLWVKEMKLEQVYVNELAREE